MSQVLYDNIVLIWYLGMTTKNTPRVPTSFVDIYLWYYKSKYSHWWGPRPETRSTREFNHAGLDLPLFSLSTLLSGLHVLFSLGYMLPVLIRSGCFLTGLKASVSKFPPFDTSCDTPLSIRTYLNWSFIQAFETFGQSFFDIIC